VCKPRKQIEEFLSTTQVALTVPQQDFDLNRMPKRLTVSKTHFVPFKRSSRLKFDRFTMHSLDAEKTTPIYISELFEDTPKKKMPKYVEWRMRIYTKGGL
jgi:hypothetical protein